MLKQGLQQKLLQKLSPQQIQLIKLLEIPTMELEQRIKKEIEENPALEEGEGEEESIDLSNEDDDDIDIFDEAENEGTDDIVVDEKVEVDIESDEFSIDDYIEDDDIPTYKLSTSNYSKDDERKDIPYSGDTSFYESLYSQIGLKNLDENQLALSEYLLGNIDEDGYLRREISSIVDDIAFTQNIETTEEELIQVLEVIQELDPAGIGARNLQECLLLQLKRKEPTDSINIAKNILNNLFDDFTKKHYDKILNKLNITEQELKQAIDEIIKLSPKPGGSYSDSNKNIQTIIPDFILDYNEGSFQLNLNSKNAPELHINPTFPKLLSEINIERRNNKKKKNKLDNTKKETVTFVKEKIEAARWFIDAIRQREITMLKTMEAILRFQSEYFKEGDETQLRPMILKDIADMTMLDISTISRVSNSKYIQTHFGIYSLKSFFSEGMQTESGEEVSTKEIKMILLECIENEDKNKPMTDEVLMEILKEKGYQIARRTIAKYREQLNIPVGRMRKEIK